MTNSTHQTSGTQPSTSNQPYWMRLTALWLMMTILMTSFGAAWAETARVATQTSSLTSSHNVLTPTTAAASANLPVLAVLVGAQAIQRPLCDPLPESCIKPADAKKARDDYAKKNGCVYLQDTCKKITVENDNKGAQNNADSSVFGKLWNDIKTSLIDGYEFAKGVVEGLIQQIIDIWDLVTNLPEVVDGLIALGKELYNHPKETLESLWSLLSEGVRDMASQATQCGAYDQGYLIGSYVSPAVVLKVVTKLSKASKLANYTVKIEKVVDDIKLELHCPIKSSFTAGTLIQTPQGNIAIETVAAGNEVYSRDDQHMRDSVQPVTKTFGRIAPSYRVITTEQEVIYVTDEHPLWVQGKGWTPAKEIKEDDVVAGRQGDMLILDNSPIAKSVQVYNFSVYRTHSYFVGESGLWAHNVTVCNFIPGGGLKAHEGAKAGHTLERHVNVTRQDIIDRANGRGKYLGERPPSRSSRFTDEKTAEFVVDKVIGDNQAEIAVWLKTAKDGDSMPWIYAKEPFGKPIGEGVLKNTETVDSLSNATVGLKKVGNSFVIITAFPS